jgi:flagellar hook-length control protein FliK
MKLTGWFSQDKIADNSRVQTPNNANTEQVNRQIRALVPGQTLRGEVVSREGNNAQIRLLQDVLVDAKVDADIRLELGQNITFQVKNNGQTLNLSPLFTNMATEGTVLKALDMASLPVNENTVAMTKQLMDAGLPIDKNTLQQIWHESNAFPDAEILDLVNLHRVELPVTEENITQMASYRNLTHQLTAGIAETGESLTNMLQGLVESGDIEQAATIYSEVLELLAFEDAVGETVTGQQQTEGPLPEPGVDVTVTPEEAEQMPVQPSATAPEAVPGQKTIIEEPTETASGNGQTIKENPGAEKTQEAPQLQNLQKLLKQGLETKDIPLLRSILHNSKVAELPAKLLADRWSIKPEDVESPEKVEELYQKLGKQLKGLSNLLEENGQRGSSAYQNVTNLSQNVDFLQQINQTYAYIQLPLHLRQGEHKTGELFVYTNKKNLARKDGQVSALLHLDMEHLGPLDVYVTLKDTKVSTKFYVQNDTILDYLEANMDVLTERLQKRGYDCKCETTLRTELQQTAQAMAPLLKTEGSVPVAQYAFDVRT